MYQLWLAYNACFDDKFLPQAATKQVHGPVHEQQGPVQEDEQNTENLLHKGAEKHHGRKSHKTSTTRAWRHLQPTWHVSLSLLLISFLSFLTNYLSALFILSHICMWPGRYQTFLLMVKMVPSLILTFLLTSKGSTGRNRTRRTR